MSDKTCDVAILMGSKSDLPTMKPAADVLQALGLRVAVRVLSAHRTPEQTATFVKDAAEPERKSSSAARVALRTWRAPWRPIRRGP
jgi:phosphoribosylcarboxyaminoimidazole (NCAIR) mutase